jgi:hypothetical protein
LRWTPHGTFPPGFFQVIGALAAAVMLLAGAFFAAIGMRRHEPGRGLRAVGLAGNGFFFCIFLAVGVNAWIEAARTAVENAHRDTEAKILQAQQDEEDHKSVRLRLRQQIVGASQDAQNGRQDALSLARWRRGGWSETTVPNSWWVGIYVGVPADLTPPTDPGLAAVKGFSFGVLVIPLWRAHYGEQAVIDHNLL